MNYKQIKKQRKKGKMEQKIFLYNVFSGSMLQCPSALWINKVVIMKYYVNFLYFNFFPSDLMCRFHWLSHKQNIYNSSPTSWPGTFFSCCFIFFPTIFPLFFSLEVDSTSLLAHLLNIFLISKAKKKRKKLIIFSHLEKTEAFFRTFSEVLY